MYKILKPHFLPLYVLQVLKYQRQLQLNYVQMLRRSKHLENQLENLSLELDLNRRTKKPLQTTISHTAIQL
jgi:Fez1.